jgi:hypothetical protein
MVTLFSNVGASSDASAVAFCRTFGIMTSAVGSELLVRRREMFRAQVLFEIDEPTRYSPALGRKGSMGNCADREENSTSRQSIEILRFTPGGFALLSSERLALASRRGSRAPTARRRFMAWFQILRSDLVIRECVGVNGRGHGEGWYNRDVC